MLYRLVPQVGVTEGKIHGFQVQHLPHVIDVSRRTYTYTKEKDGSFKQLPEEWVGGDRNFSTFVEAMNFALLRWFGRSGPFIPGDTISCDFEGTHHEWIVE